ncbi:uncharacterized protein G2W53_014000 [Senna tora]|uniref:Uncharacterized protein n=1 Tax=Senna tora TaxID=362788 RepID=A0A834WR56_9FABA|nr:uncharacterized protein G2W53_014000 [Senna tora]
MQAFEPEVSKAILGIPLSRRGGEDIWMWSLTGNGIFSPYKSVHKSYEASNGWSKYEQILVFYAMKEGRKDELSIYGREAEVSAKWDPPHWSNVKVNVDAGYENNGDGRIGCVIRNYNGRCPVN